MPRTISRAVRVSSAIQVSGLASHSIGYSFFRNTVPRRNRVPDIFLNGAESSIDWMKWQYFDPRGRSGRLFVLPLLQYISGLDNLPMQCFQPGVEFRTAYEIEIPLAAFGGYGIWGEFGVVSAARMKHQLEGHIRVVQ